MVVGQGYRVLLHWRPYNYGGSRPMFICPQCARNVAILYDGDSVACRRCHGLAYASQSETAADRALRRAGKIRRLLGWQPGIGNPAGGKPDGMHWRTFERLRMQHNAAALVWLRLGMRMLR